VRQRIVNIINPIEAANLSRFVGYIDFTDHRLDNILGTIQGIANVSVLAPSYVRVEENKSGHPWHIDQGNNGHMSWCNYSASILLTSPDKFKGGGFYFDGDKEPTFHYCDLLMYDSHAKNRHCVKRNSGGRKALIMFFASK
jgi:hypothetical protein